MTKKKVRSFGFIIAVLLPVLLLVPLLASCRIDPNYIDGNSVVYEGSEKWMTALADDTVVVNMVIPGSHDSCANYDYLGLSSTSATQDLTLREQLDAGVRCFDIRIYNDNGVYKIHHGLQYMHMTLDDVVSVFKNFLSSNPGEFIILLAMGEYQTATNGVTDILESYIEDEPSLWYSYSNLDSSVVLSDLRGKIVGGLRYSDSGRTSCLDNTSYSEKGVPYRTTDVSGNYNTGISYIESIGSSALTSLNVSFFSCYYEGQFGIPNIRICSSFINPSLKNYLSAYEESGQHFGVIVTDHISRDLAHTIYMCNDF